MKMRILIIASAVVLSATTLVAFAGKAERDYMQKDVVPVVKDAEAKWLKSCGCPLAITVDESSIQTRSDLGQAHEIAVRVGDGVVKYCTDNASKKALCQLKSLTIAKEKPAGFTFKDGKGVASTDGQSPCSWGQITKVLDK